MSCVASKEGPEIGGNKVDHCEVDPPVKDGLAVQRGEDIQRPLPTVTSFKIHLSQELRDTWLKLFPGEPSSSDGVWWTLRQSKYSNCISLNFVWWASQTSILLPSFMLPPPSLHSCSPADIQSLNLHFSNCFKLCIDNCFFFFFFLNGPWHVEISQGSNPRHSNVMNHCSGNSWVLNKLYHRGTPTFSYSNLQIKISLQLLTAFAEIQGLHIFYLVDNKYYISCVMQRLKRCWHLSQNGERAKNSYACQLLLIYQFMIIGETK